MSDSVAVSEEKIAEAIQRARAQRSNLESRMADIDTARAKLTDDFRALKVEYDKAGAAADLLAGLSKNPQMLNALGIKSDEAFGRLGVE